MKLTTKYWLATRHIGDATWPTEGQELAVSEIILTIARIMRETTLAKELVFSIGRSKIEVEQRVLGIKLSGKLTDLEFDAELDSELKKFLDDLED